MIIHYRPKCDASSNVDYRFIRQKTFSENDIVACIRFEKKKKKVGKSKCGAEDERLGFK